MANKTNTSPLIVSKRQFLRGFSQCVGGGIGVALAVNSVSVAMAYSPQTDSASRAGNVLTKNELILLKQICARVIPVTDTPGAAEVDVHGFIDNQLFHCYDELYQKQTKQLLLHIEQVAVLRHKITFNQCDKKQQHALLTDFDLGQNKISAKDQEQFKSLKALICFGYYTSEVGATQELKYEAIPGGFKGQVPYASVGRGWGSLPNYNT